MARTIPRSRNAASHVTQIIQSQEVKVTTTKDGDQISGAFGQNPGVDVGVGVGDGDRQIQIQIQIQGQNHVSGNCSMDEGTMAAAEALETSVARLVETVQNLTDKVIATIQKLPPAELFAPPEKLTGFENKVSKFRKKLPESTLSVMREEVQRQERDYFNCGSNLGSLLPEDYYLV